MCSRPSSSGFRSRPRDRSANPDRSRHLPRPCLLRDIAEGRVLGDVTTLRDPAVMEQLETKVKELQAAED
jgi:hypothetical protein